MLKLTIVTDQNIHAIKELRAIAGLGLKEAKDMVERGMIFDLTYSGAERMHTLLTKLAIAAKVPDYTGRTLAYTVTIEPYAPVQQPVDMMRCDVHL